VAKQVVRERLKISYPVIMDVSVRPRPELQKNEEYDNEMNKHSVVDYTPDIHLKGIV
jgi:hypothetical protein